MAAKAHDLFARPAGCIEDREPIALRVIDTLLGQQAARADKKFETVFWIGHRFDERVREDAFAVAETHARWQFGLP